VFLVITISTKQFFFCYLNTLASIYIYLHSSDQLNDSGNPATFTVSLSNTSLYSGAQGLSLHQISFINTEYPINPKNNTLILRQNGATTDLTVTISPGNYSITDFQNTLKAALDAAGTNTYTITYNNATKNCPSQQARIQ
jgi:hypothetical protein